MVTRFFISWCLMALCVAVHAIGMMSAFRRVDRSPALSDPRILQPTWLLIRIAGWLIALHLFEISVWASFYVLGNGMPDAHSAFYFSTVTYTTVGYGDVVLPVKWRLVGGIEALTGILMCGWSTGFFFTVLNLMHRSRQVGTSCNGSVPETPP